MSIVVTTEKVEVYTWKCPKCRHKVATYYQKATENASKKHLEWHEKQEERERTWASRVQSEVGEVKR